jgi:hypothetical protein
MQLRMPLLPLLLPPPLLLALHSSLPAGLLPFA